MPAYNLTHEDDGCHTAQICTAFLPLVRRHIDDRDALKGLLALCEVANEFASDDHSVTYDMTEYVQECVAVAEGRGDAVWRNELLDVVAADIATLRDE